MSTAPAPAPQDTDRGGRDDLFHLFCCDEDTALCGADITDEPITDGADELHCIVCEDLRDADCSIVCAHVNGGGRA